MKQQGYTLVEMMVALFIGTFLMAGSIDILLSNKQTNSLQIALSKLQQDGRLAMNVLSSDIRMADYSGCYTDLSEGVENTLNSTSSFAWDLSTTIQGYDDISASFTVSDSASGGVISNIIEGTDVLVIKGMADGAPVSTNPDTSTFTVDESLHNLQTGEVLIVADCEQASMFQASSITSTGGVTTILHASGGMTPDNNVATVANSFGSNAEIGRLTSTIYYIKNDTSGTPGLFQSSLSVNTAGTIVALEENQLASNVENMQIQYGVDTDDDQDVDEYRNAGAVTDWQTVISIRMALLLASDNDYLIENAESYSFDDSTFSFIKDDPAGVNADHSLRRTFTGFMALRNRTL